MKNLILIFLSIVAFSTTGFASDFLTRDDASNKFFEIPEKNQNTILDEQGDYKKIAVKLLEEVTKGVIKHANGYGSMYEALHSQVVKVVTRENSKHKCERKTSLIAGAERYHLWRRLGKENKTIIGNAADSHGVVRFDEYTCLIK